MRTCNVCVFLQFPCGAERQHHLLFQVSSFYSFGHSQIQLKFLRSSCLRPDIRKGSDQSFASHDSATGQMNCDTVLSENTLTRTRTNRAASMEGRAHSGRRKPLLPGRGERGKGGESGRVMTDTSPPCSASAMGCGGLAFLPKPPAPCLSSPAPSVNAEAGEGLKVHPEPNRLRYEQLLNRREEWRLLPSAVGRW